MRAVAAARAARRGRLETVQKVLTRGYRQAWTLPVRVTTVAYATGRAQLVVVDDRAMATSEAGRTCRRW